MNKSPLVSIGIPTVDRFAYFHEALESALNQTYTQVEILVSHNPGNEGLDKRVAKLGQARASAHPNVRYFANARRLSLGGNFNALADRANGKYLIILGDDDRLLPECVSELYEAIERDNADVAFSNHWFIDASGARLEAATRDLTRQYGRDRLSSGLQSHPTACVWRNSVPLPASMYAVANVRRLRFREDTNAVDIEFHARLAAEGARFVFVPKMLSEYRIHTDSETARGLEYERLIEHLSDIPVPPDCEDIKRHFLEDVIFAIVKDKLLKGDIDRARTLIAHKYYPRFALINVCRKGNFGAWQRATAQRLLARLPGHLGLRLIGIYRRVRAIFSTA